MHLRSVDGQYCGFNGHSIETFVTITQEPAMPTIAPIVGLCYGHRLYCVQCAANRGLDCAAPRPAQDMAVYADNAAFWGEQCDTCPTQFRRPGPMASWPTASQRT